jgi:hypothetical protein
MFSGEATNTNFIVFGLTQPGLEPTIEASTLTITPTDAVIILMRQWFLLNSQVYNNDVVCTIVLINRIVLCKALVYGV